MDFRSVLVRNPLSVLAQVTMSWSLTDTEAGIEKQTYPGGRLPWGAERWALPLGEHPWHAPFHQLPRYPSRLDSMDGGRNSVTLWCQNSA